MRKIMRYPDGSLNMEHVALFVLGVIIGMGYGLAFHGLYKLGVIVL